MPARARVASAARLPCDSAARHRIAPEQVLLSDTFFPTFLPPQQLLRSLARWPSAAAHHSLSLSLALFSSCAPALHLLGKGVRPIFPPPRISGSGGMLRHNSAISQRSFPPPSFSPLLQRPSLALCRPLHTLSLWPCAVVTPGANARSVTACGRDTPPGRRRCCPAQDCWRHCRTYCRGPPHGHSAHLPPSPLLFSTVTSPVTFRSRLAHSVQLYPTADVVGIVLRRFSAPVTTLYCTHRAAKKSAVCIAGPIFSAQETPGVFPEQVLPPHRFRASFFCFLHWASLLPFSPSPPPVLLLLHHLPLPWTCS